MQTTIALSPSPSVSFSLYLLLALQTKAAQKEFLKVLVDCDMGREKRKVCRN